MQPTSNEFPITAEFTYEIADFDKKTSRFVNRSSKTWSKNISMIIDDSGPRSILRFIGGPTGFESYYVDDLLGPPTCGPGFCICGGTVNVWPRCIVSYASVRLFLKTKGYL